MKDIYKLCVCIPLVGGEYVKEYDEIVDEVLINVHTSAAKRKFPYIIEFKKFIEFIKFIYRVSL